MGRGWGSRDDDMAGGCPWKEVATHETHGDHRNTHPLRRRGPVFPDGVRRVRPCAAARGQAQGRQKVALGAPGRLREHPRPHHLSADGAQERSGNEGVALALMVSGHHVLSLL